MRRTTCEERSGWQQRAEERGLIFHSPTSHGAPARYWNEGVYYEFSMAEIEKIESATAAVHALCLAAVDHIVSRGRYDELDMWEAAIPLVERSWRQREPSLYGRMDFAYDGSGEPKLLEYNADTPTSLLEAAVIQWDWLQDKFQQIDQFNSLHERLVQRWGEIASGLVHFAHLDDLEDAMTVGYLRDTAMQAGLGTSALWMSEIGWSERSSALTDLEDRKISRLFKLYPWEWLMNPEDGGLADYVPRCGAKFIEPAWKMLLSCKGILPILWELNPGHQNLLPCFADSARGMASFVSKPFYSREGQNIAIHEGAGVLPVAETDGVSANERMIWQARGPVFNVGSKYAVIGSWVVGDDPAGMGIRESAGPITDNLAMFTPHVIRGDK